MEHLREPLVFHKAEIEDWTHRNTEKGLKVHFVMSSLLDKEMAATLGCEYMLAGDGAPNSAVLDAELKETELILPIPGSENGTTSFYPDVVYKFRVHKEDTQIEAQCRVHVSSRLDELHALLKDLKGTFDVSVRPRQGDLFEGGSRVDMSADSDGADDVDPGEPETLGPLFETKAEVPETSWPEPDADGAYDETHAHKERFEQKWGTANIRVLEIVSGWIRAETCRIRDVGYSNELTVDSPAYETKEEAIISGCEEIVLYCYKTPPDGWSKKDRERAQAIGQWAQRIIERMDDRLTGGEPKDASGNPFDATSEEPDYGCVDCNNGIGLVAPGVHESGQPCTRTPAEAPVN